MPKFRKKPVVIEAVKVSAVLGMIDDPVPEWIKAAIHSGVVTEAPDNGWSIKTPEGPMTASPGDWIIHDIQGDLYPCQPDIFAATYEPVEPSEVA